MIQNIQHKKNYVNNKTKLTMVDINNNYNKTRHLYMTPTSYYNWSKDGYINCENGHKY